MKAFIIHTYHDISIKYANMALESFDSYIGWKPELFLGVTPNTLQKYEDIYPLKTKQKSRAIDFFNGDMRRYKTKKCCAYNHYRLFKKCVEINEPIAVIEHDSHCVGNWKDYKFDDILVMNPSSAIKQKVLEPIWNINRQPIENGINDISFKGLNYRHDPALIHAHMMPGTAAYSVTPIGAQKILDVFENVGWEQSDFIINTGFVRIQTIMPELFTFKLPNLSMSHRENML